MKRICAVGAMVLLGYAAPAAAQSYPGQEVTVNPGALGSGYLLYPGGKYGRFVPNLLVPGERGAGVVHLHMPVKHRHVARRVAPKPATGDDFASNAPLTVPDSPPPAPKPRRRAPPAQTAAATPPPQPSGNQGDLPEDSAARLFADTPPPAQTAPSQPAQSAPPPSRPRRTAAAPPAKPAQTPAPAQSAGDFFYNGPPGSAAPPAGPRRVATATPPPAASPVAGLRKQNVINFAPGDSSPALADVNAIHSLATTLNQALSGGAGRVQIQAYAGPRGDKSSDSRRLSLKRALVIRELLIEDGVPSEKIDVRAMGGADDNGAADRVDVFLRS